MSNPAERGVGQLRPVDVLAVKDGQSHLVRFLGGYTGTILHYLGRTYTPCQGEGVCPTATHAKKALWRGWSPVEHWDDVASLWWPRVLEITENLEEQLRGRQLRGEVWVVSRPKLKDVGNPVVATFIERQDCDLLRKAFDLRPVLLRVYHCQDMQLGKANPVPPKLLLAASEGKLPDALVGALPEPVKPITPEEREKFRKMVADLGLGKAHTNGTHKPAQKGGQHRG